MTEFAKALPTQNEHDENNFTYEFRFSCFQHEYSGIQEKNEISHELKIFQPNPFLCSMIADGRTPNIDQMTYEMLRVGCAQMSDNIFR